MNPLLILAALASSAFADRALTLAWTPNITSEMVTSYKVSVDGKIAATVDGATAQVTIPDAKCSVTVTAVNSLGMESGPSTPLVIPASPSNPTGVRVTAILRTTVSTP